VTTNQEGNETQVSVFENKVQVTVKGETTQSQEIEVGEKAIIEGEGQKISLAKITTEEQNQNFYQWNKSLNEGKEPTETVPTPSPKTATPKPTTAPIEPASGNIHLSAAAGPEKVTLTWTLDGSAPYGFKLMKSENSNPTYPPRDGDHFKYLSSPSTKSYTWTGLAAGKTYHFRVGIYNGAGKIVAYSADITSTPLNKIGSEKNAETSEGYATSINLTTTSQTTGQVNLNWSITGGNAKDGFKLCYADHSNPTYPESNCKWQNAETRSYIWNLASGNTYHFRVGILANGKISVYSNNVEATVK
jgi:hypothetical protein